MILIATALGFILGSVAGFRTACYCFARAMQKSLSHEEQESVVRAMERHL